MAVAYRTRVSVQNMFVVKGGDGVLAPQESCRVSISSKPTTLYESSEDLPSVKFAVELLEVDDRLHELGAKTFWQRYSPEGRRVPVLTTCSVSSLKPISRKRAGSPSRVSWADESPDELEKDSAAASVMSPNAEKHKKHIAEMESILNDLKGQLASESPKARQGDGASAAPDVNLEDILKIGKALLRESVDLTKEPLQEPLQEQQHEETHPDSPHRDAQRFQPRPAPVITAVPAPAGGVAVASPKPFSKPRGRLFELMIKNVSRDQLLTAEEAEVIFGHSSSVRLFLKYALCTSPLFRS